MFNAQAFADHWVDLVVTALLACLGYFITDRLRTMDARHQRAEDKFDEIEKEHANLDKRVCILESRRSGRIPAE